MATRAVSPVCPQRLAAAPRVGGQGFAPDLAPKSPHGSVGTQTSPMDTLGSEGTPANPSGAPVPLTTTPRSFSTAASGVSHGVRGANRGEKSCHSPSAVLKRWGDSQATSPQKNIPGSHPQNRFSRGFSPQVASWAATPSPHSPRAPPRLRPSSPLTAPPRAPCCPPRPPRRYLPCRARRGPRIAALGPHRDTDQTKGAAIFAPGGSGVSLLRPPAARGGEGPCACAGGRGEAGHVVPPGFPPVSPERRHDGAGRAVRSAGCGVPLARGLLLRLREGQMAPVPPHCVPLRALVPPTKLHTPPEMCQQGEALSSRHCESWTSPQGITAVWWCRGSARAKSCKITE